MRGGDESWMWTWTHKMVMLFTRIGVSKARSDLIDTTKY